MDSMTWRVRRDGNVIERKTDMWGTLKEHKFGDMNNG